MVFGVRFTSYMHYRCELYANAVKALECDEGLENIGENRIISNVSSVLQTLSTRYLPVLNSTSRSMSPTPRSRSHLMRSSLF